MATSCPPGGRSGRSGRACPSGGTTGTSQGVIKQEAALGPCQVHSSPEPGLSTLACPPGALTASVLSECE